MEALYITSPYGDKVATVKPTYQNDGKAAELHLHTVTVAGEMPESPRVDAVLRLAVNQPFALQIADRVNLAETGLAVDENGHLIIENYTYTGPVEA